MKTILRSIAAVLAGYAVFGAVAFPTFALTGVRPDVFPGIAMATMVTVLGVAGSLAGGYVLGKLAPSRGSRHGAVLAGILAAIAAVSMIMQWGETSPWTQITSIVVFSPAILLGAVAAGR